MNEQEREMDRDLEDGWKEDARFAAELRADRCVYPHRATALCPECEYLCDFADWDDWCCDDCYEKNLGKPRPTIKEGKP